MYSNQFALSGNRYNFLDKSVGVSSLFEIANNSFRDVLSQTVETNFPLHVPGLEGLVIPSKTCGRILRLVGENTALVRWEVNDQLLMFVNCFLSLNLFASGKDLIVSLTIGDGFPMHRHFSRNVVFFFLLQCILVGLSFSCCMKKLFFWSYYVCGKIISIIHKCSTKMHMCGSVSFIC